MRDFRPAFDDATSRGPSQNLWKDAPDIAYLMNQPTAGWYIWDDFCGFRTATNVGAAEAYWANGFTLFGDATADVSSESDERGGVITIDTDADNESVAIGSMVTPFQIDQNLGDLWFEARIKTSTIADTKHGFFLGLADSTALANAVPLTTADALADLNLVGFWRREADGDYVDTVYKADGVTAVTVKADAQVLVADTFIKLGMRYDAIGQVLKFYVNGTALADSKDIPAADGTDFPNDVRLRFVFALQAAAASPGSASIDWVRCIQVPADNVT